MEGETVKRQIVGLKTARALETKPGCIPTGRARGVKAYGVRYEKALAGVLPLNSIRGRWYEFEDKNGHGYCQTDFDLLDCVLECKHTWTEDGHVELEKLYLPVVRLAWGRQAFGIVVVKKLVPGMRKVEICGDLDSAIAAAKHGHRTVFHWIGGSILNHDGRVGAKAA